MDHEEKLCNYVETVREFTHVGDWVNLGGGCEAAMSTKIRCGWVNVVDCGKLLYGKRFPLSIKGTVYNSYVGPAMLYGNEAWYQKEIEMSILWTGRSILRAMNGIQLKDMKRVNNFILVLGLSETVDQTAMAKSVDWCGHVLRKEDGLS